MQHTFHASPPGRPYQETKLTQKDEDLELSLREHLLRAARAGAEEARQQPQQHASQSHSTGSQLSSQASLSQTGSTHPASLVSPLESAGQQSQMSPQTPSVLSTIQMASHGQMTPRTVDSALSSEQYPISHQHPQSPADGLYLSDRRKANRELSTSRRAEQNRAAQRAFRQRKENYIRKLKDHVDELEQMTENMQQLRQEYEDLKTYTLNLQSKLIELRIDFPAPPSSLAQGDYSISAGAAASRARVESGPPAPDAAPTAPTIPTAPMSTTVADRLQEAAVEAARYENITPTTGRSQATIASPSELSAGWAQQQPDSGLKPACPTEQEEYAQKLTEALKTEK